jgi:hypothetical protein
MCLYQFFPGSLAQSFKLLSEQRFANYNVLKIDNSKEGVFENVHIRQKKSKRMKKDVFNL